MLPNISLNSPTNTGDVSKQLSTIRSQMASLKEAIEDELNSISYDQLDLALRKKIDSIDEIQAFAQEQTDIIAETITTEMLLVKGDILSINGSISTINGDISTVKGNISTINGNISTISGNISTLSGNISTLSGNISTINGDIVTINGDIATLNGTVSGLRGEFDTLKSKSITTDNLSSQISALNSIVAKTILLSGTLQVEFAGKTRVLTPTTMTIGGAPYVILATTYQ